MNQPKNRTAGHTSVHSVHSVQTLTVSCIVTQLTRESFGICRFRGSCWFVYERIRFNLINPKVFKVERGSHVRCWTLSLLRFLRSKNATCLRGHFAQ